MFNLAKMTAGAGLFSALLLITPLAEAAPINYTFSGGIDSGSLTSENYNGSFSFDTVTLTHTGSESVGLSSFTLNFLATSFDLSNADFTPTADFLDDLFLGVTYSVSGFGPVMFSLVSALPGDTPYFAYQTTSGDSGFGSLSITHIAAVPLPGAIWLFGSSLGLLTVARRRKTKNR